MKSVFFITIVAVAMIGVMVSSSFAEPVLYDENLVIQEYARDIGWGYTTMTFVGDDILLLQKIGVVSLIRDGVMQEEPVLEIDVKISLLMVPHLFANFSISFFVFIMSQYCPICISFLLFVISSVIVSIEILPIILKVSFLYIATPLLLKILEIPSAYPMPRIAIIIVSCVL